MARNLVTLCARDDYRRIGGWNPRVLASFRRASERNEVRMFLERVRRDPDGDDEVPEVRPVTAHDVC